MLMTFYVDVCTHTHTIYFQYIICPRSVGQLVASSTMSRHFGAKTKIFALYSLKTRGLECS